MPLKHYQAAARFPGIRPLVRAVFLTLADHANESGECWPSIETIAERNNISRPSACKAIEVLRDKGAIKKKKGVGRTNTSVYRILTEGENGKAILPFTGEKGKIHDGKRLNIETPTFNKDRTDKEQIKEHVSRNSREAAALNGSEDGESGDLFGNTNTAEQPRKPPSRAKRQKQGPRQPDPFRELTDTLTALWSQKYEGQKPNWRKCDFMNLRKLCAPNGPEEITRRFHAFLEDLDKFFRGHPLGKFVSQFDRWAKPAPTAAAPAMPKFHPDELLD